MRVSKWWLHFNFWVYCPFNWSLLVVQIMSSYLNDLFFLYHPKLTELCLLYFCMANQGFNDSNEHKCVQYLFKYFFFYRSHVCLLSYQCQWGPRTLINTRSQMTFTTPCQSLRLTDINECRLLVTQYSAVKCTWIQQTDTPFRYSKDKAAIYTVCVCIYACVHTACVNKTWTRW